MFALIDSKWLEVSASDAFMVVLSATVVYASILLYTRIVGLRSFSKISASDFAMTVAVGSLFASSISKPRPSLGVTLIAFGCLYAGQWFLAFARTKFSTLVGFVENEPLLLMRDGEFLSENMAKSNVTRSDVIAKLREANVTKLEQARAVIFETTGDISVLHSEDPNSELDDILLEGVKS